jgi:hypothetical protein
MDFMNLNHAADDSRRIHVRFFDGEADRTEQYLYEYCVSKG